MTTPKRIQTHWPEVRQFMKREWPLFSDTALRNINGNVDLFLKCLKESYNHFPLEEAKARDKLQKFLNSLDGIS